MQLSAAERIFIAADLKTEDAAKQLLEPLSSKRIGVKIGKELFTAQGPSIVRTILDTNARAFLDLKYHDIPNTTAEACRAAAALGVHMINVHIDAGRRALEQAVKAAKAENPEVLILGVTVLTSLKFSDFEELGYLHLPPEIAGQLPSDWKQYYISNLVRSKAQLAASCGLDGIVCSAQDLQGLSYNRSLDNLIRVTPGIRPIWAEANDQDRVMTPYEAIMAGATMLVIGRPITKPPVTVGSSVRAVELIIKEVDQAMSAVV